MWTLFCFVHLYFIYGSCQVIQAPMNTAVVVGQRLDMTCQPESNFTVRAWFYQIPFNTTDLKIYANWSSPRIHIEHFDYYTDDNDSINIYVNSTESEDAGTYNCYVQLGPQQPDIYSAQVTVLETYPICEESTASANNSNNTLEEGDSIWMKCSVNYRGNLAPTFEWRQHGADGDIEEHGRVISDMVATTDHPDTNISSILTVVIKSAYNATYFACRTYFQWDNNTSSSNSTAATNAPDYSYTWNSSIIIVSDTTFVQEETTVSASMRPSVDTATENGPSSSFDVFNATFLVAGVAVLFGIASSLVALILCLRLRRKNSVAIAIADFDRVETFSSHYDLIPYAITDGYDNIEEVDEMDDILFPNFPPRHGPLPSPGYSALKPDEPRPPGVYSRMEHKEKTGEDEKSDDDDKKLETDIDGTKPDHSKLSDVYEGTVRTTMRSNNYLDLTTEAVKDIEAEGDDIPSAYLTTTESNVAVASHSKDLNGYLQLLSKSDKEMEDNDEIPSAYLRITDDDFQACKSSNVKEVVLENEIPSSYLTTREIDSSALQHSVL